MPSIFGPKRRVLPLILMTVPLWACSPPQDFGNVKQILDGADSQEADFQVQPVDALTLPMVQGWPSTHAGNVLGWVGHGGGSPDSRIAPGDVLNLSVYGSSETALLNAPIQLPNLKVSSTGTVFLPYVDEVEVKGLTEAEARKLVQDRMAAIIPDVQVQLQHAAGTQNSVDVVSGLPRNGAYPLPNGQTTVMQILAAAGGLPETQNNPQINLERGGRLYRVGAKTILEDPALDAVLQGGDSLYVTPDDRYFLSLGAAGREAMVNFPKDTITALDAMSLIGGVNQTTADPHGILILRTYPATALAANPDRGPSKQKVVFAFDLTSADGLFAAGQFQVEDHDLVLVTQSTLVNTRTILNAYLGFLSAGRTTVSAVNSVSN